ncbi:MAG: biopolymer transporter ExbD [Saprospiraceae bacterium]
MGLKKRSKVSAEFNMSSLTDIIFLLLIFFMLTSSLVAPNALNLKLPGSSRASTSVPSQIDRVKIDNSGRYFLNGRRMSLDVLNQELTARARRSSSKFKFVIEHAKSTPVQDVVAVMNIALKLDADGILAAEK